MSQITVPELSPKIDDAAEPSRPGPSSAPGTPTIVSGTPADFAVPAPSKLRAGQVPEPKSAKLYDRLEAFISRLSVRDNFWAVSAR